MVCYATRFEDPVFDYEYLEKVKLLLLHGVAESSEHGGSTDPRMTENPLSIQTEHSDAKDVVIMGQEEDAVGLMVDEDNDGDHRHLNGRFAGMLSATELEDDVHSLSGGDEEMD
jgi:hypothetical protein